MNSLRDSSDNFLQDKSIYSEIPKSILEALQYSPLASVVSIEPLLQTIPQLIVNSEINSVLNLSDSDLDASNALLEDCNHFNLNKNREILSPVLKEIMESLNSIHMNKWSFKVKERTDQCDMQYQSFQMEPSKLGEFARTLLDQCSIDVIYPSPVTPTPHILETKRSSSEEIRDFHIETPEKDLKEDGLTDPWTPQSNVVPHTPIPKNCTRKMHLLEKESLKSEGFVNIFEDGCSNIPDDQLKNENTVDNLENLIQFIFEAEDAMVPDTSYSDACDLYTSCWIDKTASFDALCLNIETLTKLDIAIRKVSLMRLMNTLSIDMLSRLMKICARSISESEIVTLTKQLFETNSYEENLSLITKIGTSLYSLIILMRILTSEKLSKQLYFEDILIEMSHFLKSTLDNVIYVLIDVDVSKEPKLSKFKKSMNMILYNLISIIEYFGRLIDLIEIPDSVITRLEFFSIPALFIENLVSTKDQLFNYQGVEALKVASMNIIQQIYIKYPDQRMFILDEILVSLVKLPVNKQQARRYKLVDGRSIQLISALIMKLVQSCAEKDINSMEKDIEDTLSSGSNASELLEIVFDTSSQYMDSVTTIANHVISFLLSSAMKISKTNQFSYKILLDIFIEDLLLVLPLPSWPSSELLLRLIITKLLNYMDNDKEYSQIKGISLDFLGNIASKIRLFSLNSIQFANTLSNNDVFHHFSSILQIGNFSFEKLEDLKNVFQLHLLILGFFKFQSSEESKDHNMIQYSWLRWIYFIRSLKQKHNSQNNLTISDDYCSEILKLVYLVDISKNKISERDFLSDEISQLYLLSLFIYPLYQLFDPILSRILRSLDNNQVSIRAKALRSLGLIVNNDPSVLSNVGVRQHVAVRIADISSQVRDIAIDLVGKYAISQREIGQQYYSVFSERIADTGLGVRKRVIKFLRDFYAISDNQEIQADIGRKLIQRLCDEEDSVKDLSEKAIEEIWFSAPENLTEENVTSMKFKKTQMLKISILQNAVESLRDEDRFLFKIFLQKVSKSKNVDSMNFVLTSFITLMFDMLLEYNQNQDMKMLERCFNTIIIFSEACPKLFSSDQLINIQPYLNGLSFSQEHAIFFYVVIIYRNVLPHIPSMSKIFLNDVQKIFLSQLTKLPAKILNEVVPCLSIIANLLGNYERVGKIMSSCIKAIEPYKLMIQDKKPINDDKKLILLLLLLGLFGRHCDLDNHSPDLNIFLNLETDTLIIKFLIDTISVFFSLSSNIHISVQKVALHSVGIICISYPSFFLCNQNLKIMSEVLEGTSIELQSILLSIFYDFLSIEEKEYRCLSGKNNQLTRDETIDTNVLTENVKKNKNEGVSISLMQRYLPQILEISMNEDTTLSITAIKILEIITTHGIANPRTCLPVIVALQTSLNKSVRDIAIKIHKGMHEKHESLIEGCYIDGVKMAFQYQTRLKSFYSDDNCDYSLLIFMYNIIKQNRQTRKRFLIALTKLLDIDISQIDSYNNENVFFSKFLVQNLASFEYNSIEEVQYIVYTANRILSTTGMSLYHQIETKEFEFQNYNIVKIGIISAQILALVLLKKYLKENYGLTEQKCRSFDPNKVGNSKDNKPINKLSNDSLNLDPISGITKSLITKSLAKKMIESFYDIILNDDLSYTEFMEVDDEHKQIENENETEIRNVEDEMTDLPETKKTGKNVKRKGKSFKNGISKKKYKHDIDNYSE
ncbi:hypothetical protein PCANB_001131 [Pneumocystis canis]|nr:hypothetical protein PCANB_001131 [Pneumocystis canis]